MAENQDGQEKTEQPTGKRLGKARDQGQVAKSQEINFVAGLAAALMYLALTGPSMVKSLAAMMRKLLITAPDTVLTPETLVGIARDRIMDIFGVIVPFALVLVVVAIMSNVMQIGFLFTLKPFEPKVAKFFDVVGGLKKLFSIKSKGIEILKSLFKLFFIGGPPYIIIKNELSNIPLIMDMGTWEIMAHIGWVIVKILFYVALVMLVLAIADLIYTRWKHTNDLKMTKQEVKDERKQAEGDPKIKNKIRRLQFEFTLKRMMQEVPKADVVVTNPVHLAVALRYERSTMQAPTVVAKGARLMAEKVKQIAREHKIPIVENRPLAQSLYKLVDIGEVIPESLFKAVAEVLAYVYRRKGRNDAA